MQPDHPASGSDDAVSNWLARWLQDASASPAFDTAVDLIDETIAAEMPELVSDPELRRDLEASTRGHLAAILSTMRENDVELPPEAYGLARTLTHRGFGVEVLFRLYRVALRATQRYFSDAVEQSEIDQELRSSVLVRMWSVNSEWLDNAVGILGTVMVDERVKWLAGAAARQGVIVSKILRGDPTDIRNASQLLAYPLNRMHTAFSLWADAEFDLLPPLAEIAVALGAIVGADAVLAVPSGERGMWMWCASSREPDLSLLSTSTALRVATGVHVAVGICSTGLDGFRRSHRQALSAQKMAVASGRTRQVTRYDDVELVAMVSADMEAMTEFVVRELGSLVEDTPATERLRDTALAVATLGVAGAAQAIPVHKNTVRYRLNQIELLLGHPIDHRRGQVELALRCVNEFGAPAFASL
ncbi:CdaR family transcriptional regulator [Rhodococcus sp. KRD162]|jgi:hypothetical protein|uniref:PucR family transcriptional regulator n=1 Tax=Rhodococcus sp. KRD162 TaxID=2729725 RepID=UPI0019D24A35|nr:MULTISPECIES: helix-turn-helix domain-containing protein [unclassified Rhodococcus (in: high G+C Gram-positive bacteria)]